MYKKDKVFSVGIALISILMSSCSSIKSMPGLPAKERVNLAKQYAMGSMLYFALKPEGFDLSDKDVSLSVCVEVGDLSLDLTNSIDKMAQSAAKSIKPSEIGDYNFKKTIVMDCVEFMNSKSVADTIDKYLKMH